MDHSHVIGFTTGLYPLAENYDLADSINLSISIGSDSEHVSNAVVVKLPTDISGKEPWLRRLLHVMVRRLKPDFAVFTSYDFRDAVEDEDTGNHIGWLNYFAHFDVTTPLDAFLIERDGEGAFVQLVEKPDQDFETDVRRAIRVRDKLITAGALKRK